MIKYLIPLFFLTLSCGATQIKNANHVDSYMPYVCEVMYFSGCKNLVDCSNEYHIPEHLFSNTNRCTAFNCLVKGGAKLFNRTGSFVPTEDTALIHDIRVNIAQSVTINKGPVKFCSKQLSHRTEIGSPMHEGVLISRLGDRINGFPCDVIFDWTVAN
ncbi:hypothetical protein [Escherichia coli]|uniref:hypothetical protein n=1 Tax=Escherichia coli TaxID=562 RepID=UPI00397D0516